jgi:hypothetical protein
VLKECRWGRDAWLRLELYDRWLSGSVLDAGDEEHHELIDILTEDEPRSDAARLTSLLKVVLSPFFEWLCVGELGSVDARQPAASQMDKFAALGFATLPTTGQVMKRMIAYSEAEETYMRAEGVYGNQVDEDDIIWNDDEMHVWEDHDDVLEFFDVRDYAA